MTQTNIQPTHVFEDGAKLYRRNGAITVEDKDGNLLPTEKVTEYARQFMNASIAKVQEERKAKNVEPVREVSNVNLESVSMTPQGAVVNWTGEIGGEKTGIEQLVETVGTTAGAGYGIESVMPYGSDIPLYNTDGVPIKPAVPTVGVLGGKSMALAAAVAALSTLETPGVKDISDREYQQRLDALQQRMRMLFQPDDRKEAKRIFATFKAGDFGIVEKTELQLPDGIFMGRGGTTATGKELIQWIGQMVGSRNLRALGRVAGGDIGRDYTWSWNLFAALTGRVLWNQVLKLPAMIEGYEKLPITRHLQVMSLGIDQIVAAARSKPRKK